MTRLGFTGTQRGMTSAQWSAVLQRLLEFDPVTAFHHGVCIGADEEAAGSAHDLGIPIEHHPPVNKSKMSRVEEWMPGVHHPHKPYLDRNRDIVDAADILIAAPGEMEEQLRSGTWATVRYARKTNTPVIICWPDGTVT